MKITADIIKSIRSKLTVKSIIILAVICVLIFPAIVIENGSIPTSDSHLYFLGRAYGINSKANSHGSNNNYSIICQKTYFVLNNKLEPVSNSTVRLNVSVLDSNLLNHFLVLLNVYFNVVTTKSGNFTLNTTFLLTKLPDSDNRTQNLIRSYRIENYTLLSSENKIVSNQNIVNLYLIVVVLFLISKREK